MNLTKFNVHLARLTEDKIEMVRNWRNDEKISSNMEYRDFITPEMQMKWFHRINNENNYYFIIIVDGNEIGLINIRDIDYTINEGEFGVFIYDDHYLNSDVSFKACVCMDDYCFEVLKMESLKARILSENKRAIQFAQFFGFKIEPDQEDVYNKMYRLVPKDYYKQREIILKILDN